MLISNKNHLNLSEATENEYLLSKALERLERNGDDPTIPLSNVMAETGITEEDVANAPDLEFE